ncbi:MAG: ribonuclease HII [Ignisphaera sp.]|nr:ribonuclease HII [Ignisphaera sp.]MCX8168111.1 ribonuclease HII [Ignisphaera sp.]MDW8085454.1 ribonuclease HII [Ignisphaera sp.]
MNIVAGIDEAGRGPLIGDMFMAIIVMEMDQLALLRKLGVKDSKKLSRNLREKLFPYIVSNSLTVIITRATPEQIDRENLNKLELKMVCRLLRIASGFYTIDKIYIDAFSEPVALTKAISDTCGIAMDRLVVKYKADSEFLVVSAASIVAKVLRDNHITLLKRIYGEFGSGYPSDHRTVLWIKHYLKQHNEVPSVVRRSWQTINRVLSQI